jgi:O-antigen/teichoic acid export membrane protein
VILRFFVINIIISVSTIKKLVSDTAVYGLSSIVGRLINYLLVPLLTRVFTQAEYGANAEFYGYISFLNILLAHGMETAFFRFSQEQKPQQVFANAFISVLSISTSFCSLVAKFLNGLDMKIIQNLFGILQAY